MRLFSTIKSNYRHLISQLMMVFIMGLCLGTFLFIQKKWVDSFNAQAETLRRQNLIHMVSIARNSIEPVLVQLRNGSIDRDNAINRIRFIVGKMTYEDYFGKNYIFMSSYDGIMLVQPFQPEMEMTDQLNIKDSKGTYIIRELIRAAITKPEGSFVSYIYTPPGEDIPQEKLSYVVGIPEIRAYIGTGHYMYKEAIAQREILLKSRNSAIIMVLLLTLPLAIAIIMIISRNRAMKTEIISRRAAQQELMASESRNKAILEAIPDYIFILSGDGRFMDYRVQTGEENSLLIKPEFFMGKKLDEVVPELAPKTMKYLTKLFSTGKNQIYQYQLEVKGLSRFYETRMVLYGPDRAMAIIRDVTKQRMLDNIWLIDKERMAALLELNSMQDSTVNDITDFAMKKIVQLTGSSIGYIAYVSQDEQIITMDKWFGEDIGNCRINVTTMDCQTETAGMWAEPVRSHKPLMINDHSLPHPLKKGYPRSHVRLERHLNVPLIENGRAVLLVGVGNKPFDYDESDLRQLTLFMEGMWSLIKRKRIEEEIARKSRELESAYETIRERERQLETLISNLPGIVYRCNNNENFTMYFLSEGFDAITGYGREEVLEDRNVPFYSLIFPDDISIVKNGVRKGLMDRKHYEIIYRLVRKNGSLIWVWDKGKGVYDDNGMLRFLEGFILDITELKNAQDEVIRLNRNLEEKVSIRTSELEESLRNLRSTQEQLVESEKMSALGRLVAGVAHEINTPVGIAVTLASFIEEKSEKLNAGSTDLSLADESIRTDLATIAEASNSLLRNLERAAHLVSSFKEVAVNQTLEVKRSFILKDYMEDILTSMTHRIKNHAEVSVDIPKEITVESYPGALSQIITNLIFNSLKHGFTQDTKGRITISAVLDNEEVMLKYGDDGKGIPTDDLPRIFDPFFTTARDKGGNGLGLHIVYNLVVHRLKGRIKCTSAPGEGTVFTITFPVILPADTDTR